MGHVIHGFIAQKEGLQQLLSPFTHARFVPLAQGLAFVPMSDELFDEITQYDPTPNPYPELYYLSAKLTRLAQQASAITPVAYIETDYFGGFGSQGAIVWAADQAVLGPVLYKTPENNQSPPLLLQERPINRALRYLGVQRGEALDEFDVLGLGRYRSNKDWIEQVES